MTGENVQRHFEALLRCFYSVCVERDEARAEVERLRARVRSVDHSTAYEGKAFECDAETNPEFAELRAEVERLRAEVEMLRGIGCREAKADEPESGPCGVCLRCAEELGAAYELRRVAGWLRKRATQIERAGGRGGMSDE